MNRTTLAVLALLFISFVWGIEFVLVHDAIALIEPHTFNTIRFALAGFVIFMGILIFRRSALLKIDGASLMKGSLLGGFLYVGFATQTMGMLYTTVSNTGFITGLCIVFVPFFAAIVLKEKLGAFSMVGIGLAMVGMYLLTMTGGYHFNKGDFLGFICAMFFALHGVYTTKFLPGESAINLAMIQMGVVTLLSRLSALATENWRLALNPVLIKDPDVVIALLVGSVLGTAIAYVVQTVSQKIISVTRVEMIFSSEPIFAAGAAWIMLGEKLGLFAVLGCLLILSGMATVELAESFFNRIKLRRGTPVTIDIKPA
jgi:drug/metabolite transporter (DMT)-like permease